MEAQTAQYPLFESAGSCAGILLTLAIVPVTAVPQWELQTPKKCTCPKDSAGCNVSAVRANQNSYFKPKRKHLSSIGRFIQQLF